MASSYRKQKNAGRFSEIAGSVLTAEHGLADREQPNQTSNLSTLKNDQEQEEEEEDNFMSDKFLKQITESPSENHKTYTEKRKRRLLEASTTRQKRSGAQREIKAQEEGLSRNSIQSTTSNSSKEPINIVTRCGRAGIGISLKLVPAAKLPRLISGPKGELKLTGEESAQREAFLSSSRSCSDGRKNDPDNLILDDDDDDDKEQQNWLALEPSTRLSCTLGYLREEYFYCIWCGLWPIVGHPRATSVTGTNRPSRATHGQHIHDGKKFDAAITAIF
ncbi:hypothetical protein PSTT_13783 [Puccinia striiformis]|uniref:DUF4187 domain-containing protein n=1 Tax=Puccinia striiformis TaxID=27350 RepID=A0A2S4UQC2_9BASI|nr:hypothetical protein PSTT_13783 [Puccinia striiformis]